MNTFWLKVAGAAVLVVAVVVGFNVLKSGSGSKTKEPETSYWDQVAKDDAKLRADAQYKGPPEGNQPARPGNQMPVAQPNTQSQVTQQTDKVEPPKPEFKKLSFEEEFEAQKLFEMALAQRKMGRLPVMSYGLMVRYCREIIQRWPDSEYAFKAKRMLTDIPERYHKQYNITPEEIDLGNLK